LLLLGDQLLLQLGEALFQCFDRQFAMGLGSMLLQALFAFLQQYPALLDGFFRRLQVLAQLAELSVVDGQQAIEAGVVQFGVAAAPLRDCALQLLVLVLQGLLALAVGVEFSGQLHALGTQYLQALGGVGVGGPSLFQLRFHMLLPGFGAGLLAEQFAEGGLGLLALFVQCGDFLQQLLLMVLPGLMLVAQLVQLLLAGLLFLLLVLALVELLAAQGNLLVKPEEGLGRVVAQCLENVLGQHAGQVVQALLQLLLVGSQGLVLLVEVALGLLLGLAGGLQLLGEASGVLLQGEQGALAFLVAVDFLAQAAQLAVEPGAASLVVLGGERRPQGMGLNLFEQRL